ncbi:hypothetical protein [Alkalicoccobacillus porphyridii]|uniref:Uncharacterized protein n=1 Tax=Alkalicoccobacillus porphyridii TaxID=2597270 RepID=A0A554A1I5_9BACI|nr:hypothetical protein [Alkalicoccobacillus porphyridii]TSB47506.1 hypothetical protein FN960_07155 [Alkalicoccobacillus porphyridii]
MRVTFEEKTYESYFNNELDNRSKIYFPPGQYQEGFLGFDSSAFTEDIELWRYLGHPWLPNLPFEGIKLRRIADEMEHFLSIKIRNMPSISVNLLFQYKKPEYITTSLGKEWNKWSQPYYRYEIYREQQELLMNIHSKLGDRVLVIYASPALLSNDELVNAHMNRKIIEFSNFRKASELNTHHRNTYIKAGNYSIACSDPEFLDNFDLINEINNFKRSKTDMDLNNIDIINNFRNSLIELINKDLYISNSFNKLNEKISEFQNHELLYTFLVLKNFRLLTGMQWVIKFEDEEKFKKKRIHIK